MNKQQIVKAAQDWVLDRNERRYGVRVSGASISVDEMAEFALSVMPKTFWERLRAWMTST